MDKQSLAALKSKGDECLFDFKPHLPVYNPLLEFIKEVCCKEKAHTSILADLLNPHGMHNVGDNFLQLFLSALNTSRISPENIEPDTISVTKERVINLGDEEQKTLDPAKKRFRRFDILIEGKTNNDENFAIVIENKLNGAQYQEYQLEAYRNLATSLIGKPENVIVVCLVKNKYIEEGNPDIQLNSKELSSIIEQGCTAKPELTTMLNPYIHYLKDLDMDKNTLQNAICLAGDNFSGEDIEVIRSFHNAYEKLPEAYEHLFEEAVKEHFDKTGIKCNVRINKTYHNYCDIWQDEIYRKKATWQWLSIGFEPDKARFFLVSNDTLNESDAIEKATKLGFEKYSYGGGAIWFDYKGSDPMLKFELLYSANQKAPGKPDFEMIAKIAAEYLKLLRG